MGDLSFEHWGCAFAALPVLLRHQVYKLQDYRAEGLHVTNLSGSMKCGRKCHRQVPYSTHKKAGRAASENLTPATGHCRRATQIEM